MGVIIIILPPDSQLASLPATVLTSHSFYWREPRISSHSQVMFSFSRNWL